MKGVTRRLLGLCLPALLACALDDGFTLLGQSPEYWDGDFTAVNEGSPTFNHLLQVHPLAFALGSVAWAAVFVGTILLLPDVLALVVSIAVTLGHSAGAATWILWRSGYQYGYQLCNALFLVMSVALALGIRYGWRAVPAERYELAGWPRRRRWTVAAVLFAVAVYLYLWPRSL